MCAAYIRNRLPSSANENSLSPFEVRYGRRPDLRHLRPFGVLAYVRIHKHITKVQPRAEKGILLGYGESVSSQKGWRVFLPSSSRVVTTTAVTFHRDLATSITSRDSSLVSNTPPDFGSDSSVPLPPTPDESDLPVSLSLQPRSPSSAASPPAAVSASPATPTLSIAPTVSTPVTVSPPAPPAVPAPAGSTVSNVITTPAQLSPHELRTARTATVRRPRGRPPANSRWDGSVGRYVRALPVSCFPSAFSVWCMVADSSAQLETPTTYAQAIRSSESDQWRRAIASELESLRLCGTWRTVPRSSMPAGSSPIRTKWVFKIKRDQHNHVSRFKARLTACGYAQKFGRDYDETFAPVASANSIRLLFALAAVLGLHISQHDVQTAFLYGVLPPGQQVFLSVPDGLDLPSDVVLRCIKAIYGLKQAPRLFNQHLTSAIASLGYSQCRSDPCVFFKHVGSALSILAIVVDDILHVASSSSIINEFARSMDSKYNMQHLGVPQFMIGIKIDIDSSAICLCQQQYIEQAAEKFGQLDSAPVRSPAHPSGCFAQASPGDSPRLDSATHPYLSLVGSLLWITITRPDVQVAVSRACSHSQHATMAHWRAAIRILRYLYATRTYALTYKRSLRPVVVSAFVDAAYGNDDGHRSRRGHLVHLSGCLVIWSTRATGTVCQSTSEAEFTAANECVKDILWLRGILREFGFSFDAPSVVREDNQATIAMVNNHLVSARNRHFCIRMSWLREQATAGIVTFVYVRSQDNLADIFTKILPEPQFRRLRDMLLSPRLPAQ